MWDIGLEALRDKCGSTVARLRQFRAELETIIKADTLPEYRLTLTSDGKCASTRETYSSLQTAS
jgi:hypothetical protein